VDHLPILLGALFAYLNIIPAACQETALRSMVSVISRPSTCEQALQSLVEQTAHAVSTCQVHDESRFVVVSILMAEHEVCGNSFMNLQKNAVHATFCCDHRCQ